MVGLFYKKLNDPIEYGLLNEGQDTYYKPMNFGDATNLGVEIDIMKYFNWFGVKANYTYTHSEVTTDKRIMDGSEVTSVLMWRICHSCSKRPNTNGKVSWLLVTPENG